MSRQDLHDLSRSERCHGGARKGAGRPKKAPLESGKITRLRLFEETARKWRTLQLRAKFSTHEEFASHLLQRYEADLTNSADTTQQIQVISSQLLDNLSKLEVQSNIGSKKRKPARIIHIDPCGSASLVKNSQKVQSIPKELHHSVQHVRTSLCNLNQELELYVNSKEDLQNNNEDICEASGDEEGILATRTCKSREDQLPPIGTVPNTHVVDIFNPKTPQKLLYTFNYSYVNSEQNTTDSSSSSSSEGFVPSSVQSVSTKHLAVIHLSDHQDQNNLENKISKPSKSRSCSPQPAKLSGQQQRPLKELSVDVVKLPQSVVTSSRNSNVIDAVHHGIFSSDETNEICITGNLMSNEDECAESNSVTFDNHDQKSPTEQGVEPTNENDLFYQENVEFNAVPCIESDNSTSSSGKDIKDGLDDFPLPTECDDDHLQNEAEVVDFKETLQNRDYKGNSNVVISSSNGKQEEIGNKLTYTEHQENVSKQYASTIKNVSLPDSETECEENVEETLSASTISKGIVKKHSKKIKSDEYVVSSCSENESNILPGTISKGTVKKHSKKIRSEKYVVSSCSENESNVPPEKLIPKLSRKQHKSSFQNFTSVSNTPAASSCEHDKQSEGVTVYEDVKSENDCASQDASQSILSCSVHEERMSKFHRNKSPTHPTSISTTARQISGSSSEQSITLKHGYSQHQSDHSVNITSKSENTATKMVVKRKLNMTECLEDDVPESTGAKRRATKYKLRSKENSMSKKFPCISCKGTINMCYSYKVHKHPRFSAYMCEKCWKLYTNGKFTVDELDGHEEYCCICGEGGEIVCCDFCRNSVCQGCIRRMAGKDYLDNLLDPSNDEKWKCFGCDTSILQIYEQFYYQNVDVNNMSKNCNSPIQDEAEELGFSESFSSSDVSGIATDEVSMSDTELCSNMKEDHFHKPGSYSSNTDSSTSKMPLSSNKRRKRAFVDPFLESDDSPDDITEQVTLLSDDEQEMVQQAIHDAIDLPSPLIYDVKSSDEQASSDSDPIVSKKSKSFRKANLVSESSQKISPNSSDNEESANLKWYSTRSKAYKGNELDGNDKVSAKKRKRRNVQVLSTESESDPDSSKPMTPGRKRRKLRRLIDDDKLEAETRRAQKDEELRLKRIKEKEKHGKGEESDKLILDGSGDNIIDVEATIASHLKPHQREGVKFLWECCCENLERLKSSPGSGAILAHCMGLGKSLQVIAFIEALLRNRVTNIKKVAIIVPVNTLENWKNEFMKWIPEHKRPRIYHLAMSNSLHGKLNELQDWFELGGILLCGYEMYRNLASGKGKGFKSKTKLAVAEYLLDPGPDIVVCDEGHVLKNPKSALSLSLNKLHTLRRIVLTGTPLQNNLMEYYTMVSFVKPNLLGTQNEFRNRFVNPIKNGQCRDSVIDDVRLMRYQSHVLHKLLKGCVQRHDYHVLTRELPPKQEYVILFRLSSIQETLYTTYLEKQVDHSNLGRSGNLFTTYQILFKIWNHPWILHLRDLQKKEEEEMASGESLKDFIVSGSEDDCTIDTKQDPSGNMSNNKQGQSSDPIVLTDSEELVPMSEDQKIGDTKSCTGETDVQWYGNIFTDDMETKLELSGKLVFLFDLLEETHQLDEKVLVFSQSLLTLDLIESFLQLPELGEWCRGLDYLRIDGSTSAGCRSYCVDTFNSIDNPKTRLFLISTKAGSLGVNLTAANRVVIFDASWNPTNDLQAIFRTYRYGQTKPVFIYRLLSKGTMEEKIYGRQVTKESLSLRVVDEKQIGRHFSQAELSELFEYSPAEQRDTPDPSLPEPKEDVILCKLLKKLHPEWITAYHEHDSLLEHRFAEELTEEEQKKAWENFEAKKTETVDYVHRAVLMTQLQQQQNSMLATGMSLGNPATSTIGGNQPVAMPYMNQPQPPGTSEQGIENVVQLAFRRCQELPTLHRAITGINNELKKPTAAPRDDLRQLQKQNIEQFKRCCKYLHDSVNLLSLSIKSYAHVPTYQAKLAAAKQFILDSIHRTTVKT